MLLRRSPLSAPRRTPTARLACLRHAASVRPEPGSNSPSENAIPAYAGSFSKLTGLAKRSYLPGFQGSITACRPCSKRTRQHALRHFVGDSDYTTSQARLSRASPFRTQVLGSQGIASAPKTLALRRAIYYHARDSVVKGLSPNRGKFPPNFPRFAGRRLEKGVAPYAPGWRTTPKNSAVPDG